MIRKPAQFLRDEGAAVAATYSIALMGLIVVAGVGYDYSRMATVDSELQNAADQAALAAATQLDKGERACARAQGAAIELVNNLTMLSDDGGGNAITVTGETDRTLVDACGATGFIRFYQDKEKTLVADTDAEARFVEVHVNPRRVFYALTPIMAAFRDSGNLHAAAFAGVGSAICRVPPLMICSPSNDPNDPFRADEHVGVGIKATGIGGWTPGGFGFLEVGTTQLNDLAKALAFNDTNFDCAPIEGTDPETGNGQVLYEAINTRFDILPGGGGVLTPCDSGSCPPARNVTKDLMNSRPNPNANQCRAQGANGWDFPAAAQRFRPRGWLASDNSNTIYNASGSPAIMGYGRDICHYNSYLRDCRLDNGITFASGTTIEQQNRFGDGKWAIRDYFAKNHGGATPPSWEMTRYEVYKWELENSYVFPASTNQRLPNTCVPGASDIDRRVVTVAIVSNCDELRGGSREVDVQEWADFFLVEPVKDDNVEVANGRDRDMIYLEVIGEAKLGGDNGAVSQAIRRDVPYLIE